MARSTTLARLVVLCVAAILVGQLAAFVALPSQFTATLQSSMAAGIVSAVAAAQPALATDGSAFDSWGAPELTAVGVPLAGVCFLYLDWESKQAPVDDVTGYGTLGAQIDGPSADEPAYFRRSPESG